MTPAVKFSVVREDPELEALLVEKTGARAVLVVASGGCTALTLKARYPSVDVSAFDFNPAQLAHVRQKILAVTTGDRDALKGPLNQCGAFEGLFHLLRTALETFVAGPETWLAFFEKRASLDEKWLASPYWPAAFHSALHDPLLHAMFGTAATQHAARGSYPGYFQHAFEAGLRRQDAPDNPFLQHVLLGRYLQVPEYARTQQHLDVQLIEGTLLDVPDLAQFDVVSLSNIFDWADDALVARWAHTLKTHARRGTHLLLRQLNNQRDLQKFFAPDFVFDDRLADRFLRMDRSLFYERFHIGVRA